MQMFIAAIVIAKNENKTNVHQLMNDKQNAEDLSAITRNKVIYVVIAHNNECIKCHISVQF